METKRSKYDTNPLDPDYVKNAEKSWSEGGSGPATQPVKGTTREVGATENAPADAYSEAPTRRYNKASLEASYPSVFVPPTYSPPAPYQPSPLVAAQAGSRSIPGIGLSEKWATVLPYTPFYIGVVISLLELFLVPRSETKVRFHAAQGLALHVAILVLQAAFAALAVITNTSVGSTLFKLAAFVFLIVSMIRVKNGKPHHISALDDPARWFNDHIELKKS